MSAVRDARDIRLLVVRHARPVRELRVRRRTLWRVGALGVIALWCVPLAALAGVAAQARDDRAQLAGTVQTLTLRSARLAANVSALERSVGVAPAARDSVGGDAEDAPPAAAIDRSLAAVSWVSDLERRVATVHDALRVRLRGLPTGRPIAGRLSSGFGWRANPFSGAGSEWHAGLDLPAPPGTAVRATADGVVEFAGWRGGYGTAVILRHGDGYSTLVGHLSGASVRTGQRVARGTVIGRVGSGGRSTGPHVHYEVRRWGKPVDPRRVLGLPRPATTPLSSDR